MSRPLPLPNTGATRAHSINPAELQRSPPMNISSQGNQQPSTQPAPAATNGDDVPPEEPMEIDPLGVGTCSAAETTKEVTKPNITTTTTSTTSATTTAATAATASMASSEGISKTNTAVSNEGESTAEEKNAAKGEIVVKGATAMEGAAAAAAAPATINVTDESASELDLLLIGKSGVGKSATGNTILGRKVFKSSASLTSVTDKICADVAKVKGRVVKVVDGPGVGDTRMDTDQGIQFFIESIKQAMFSNPSGYHALLLVLRYGTRLTKEDSDTVKLLKEVFGKDFVKRYCVIIITCGDNFKSDAEEDEFTFPEWLSEQKGLMDDLRKECNGRVILFDNITRDEKEKSEQLEELFKMISRLDNGGQRYSDENFRRTKEAREKIMVESQEPMARDKTLETLSLLLQELRDINERFKKTDDPFTTALDLETLHEKLKLLIRDIEAQDRGTGALKNLMESIQTVEKSVSTSLGFYRRMAEERQNASSKEEELKEREEMLNKQYQSTVEDAEKRALQAERDSLKLQLDKERMQNKMEREKYQQEFMRAQEMLQTGWDMFDQYRVYRERSIFIMMKDKMVDFFAPMIKGIKIFFGFSSKSKR